MSSWAIIQTGAKQYKVEEGKTIVVEKLTGENDSKITFDRVLAIGGEKVSVGTPLVEKAKVTAKILDTSRGKKIKVVKFKSKSKYTRIIGHRQQATRILIEKILT